MPVAVVPPGNVTVTVDPGSAVPPIVVSSLVTSFTVGAAGAVMSFTVVVIESEIFPLPSIADINSSSSPFKSIFSGIVIVYPPWLFALLSAVVPSGNVTVTVEPGSDMPLIVVSSLVTSFTVGASGAVASTTIVEASVDLLLDLSCAIA
ncbi:Uncharacterised protein [Staphylococcus cohnii subsp. cohnii]|nr:Uncharacterised protein [Staphylococcus cohnii subsp. cohnii]